jgi:hypothetical protein
VGPEPAAVYWRRRAALLVGAVIVIVVAVMIIKALASGGSSSANTTPSPSKPAATQAAGDAGANAPACTKEQLAGGKLALDADILLTHEKDAYPAGESVALTALVKNISAKDCSLRNNAHNVSLNVASGSDRIFDSSDCAAKVPQDSGDVIVIKAGQTATIPVLWDATRSQQGCREIAEKPFRNKDASYVAVVKVLGVVSDKTQFLLIP